MNNLNVKIIMCTYNGEEYINQQLQSLKNQSFTNWSLYIYDDISTDNTINKINFFKKSNPSININISINKSRLGFYNNFIQAIKSKTKQFDLILLSDQDDFWLPNKIERCLEHYYFPNKPFFYFSRRIICSSKLTELWISPKKSNYPWSNYHGFFQNLAGGNTIAFNKIFLDYFNNHKIIHNHYVHDWELFSLAIANNECKIIFDKDATILYRQHSKAAIGDVFYKGFFSKIRKLFNYGYRDQNLKRINFYLSNSFLYEKSFIIFVKKIQSYRDLSLIKKIYSINELKFCKYRYNFVKRFLWCILILAGYF